MTDLAIKNVNKIYPNGFTALHDISFSAEPGEFVVMVGPSGCGKSTLLRSIAGLEKISNGTIEIGGRDISGEEPSERGVAMVFQNYALYPHMTVAQNMGFALKIAGRPKAEIDAAVNRAARILRIEDHLTKKPSALSGGQKQRVAIGRAITRAPQIFLFDEPLSNLDAALRTQMRIELSRLHAELGATMVYVTHDQTEAMTMANRIVVMNAGVVEQVGAPLELYNRPRNIFVASFLGAPRMNFFSAQIESINGKTARLMMKGVPSGLELDLDVDATLAVGEKVSLGIRPESIGDGPISIPGQIALVENLGRETLLYVDTPSVRPELAEAYNGFTAVYQSQQMRVGANDPFELKIDPEKFFIFDSSGETLRFAR